MRTAATLALSLALALGVGAALPPPPRFQVNEGVHPERFWAMKLRWGASFDVALGGDSRVFRGLSPATMSEALGGLRIANFGFSSLGFTGPYLDSLGALLDPRSPRRVIFLGVTPHSLTHHAARANGYLSERARSPQGVRARLYLSPLSSFFRPVSLDQWLDSSPPGGAYIQNFHTDGWVASRLLPETPDSALPEYERILEPLDPALVRALLARVERFRREGVEVVACRPPSSPAIRALEERRTGFQEAQIAACLTRAGARWLRVGDYPTYDGSHLREDGALAWSRDLAAALARGEDDGPQAPWYGGCFEPPP